MPIKMTWYYKKLHEYCCRLTKPRQAILGILHRGRKHLSAEEIRRQVSRISPTVGLATIYRNLELLVRIGLVWKFEAGDNKSVYEIAKRPGERHHHHLICTRCNTVIDYEDTIDNEKDFVKQREKNLSRKYNFRIENHSIDFFGLCDKCKNKDGRKGKNRTGQAA